MTKSMNLPLALSIRAPRRISNHDLAIPAAVEKELPRCRVLLLLLLLLLLLRRLIQYSVNLSQVAAVKLQSNSWPRSLIQNNDDSDKEICC